MSDRFCEEPNERTPPDLAIWMETKNALYEQGGVPMQIWRELPNLLFEWKRTNNYSYVDVAVSLCEKHSYKFPDVLTREVVAAAKGRLSKDAYGNDKKIERDAQNQLVFHWVVCFVAAGISLNQSAQKTAALFARLFPREEAKMASSIQKYYRNQIKKSVVNGKGRLETMKEIFAANPSDKAEITALAESLNCPPELIGTVR